MPDTTFPESSANVTSDGNGYAHHKSGLKSTESGMPGARQSKALSSFMHYSYRCINESDWRI
jgi:hypothetical protein